MGTSRRIRRKSNFGVQMRDRQSFIRLVQVFFGIKRDRYLSIFRSVSSANMDGGLTTDHPRCPVSRNMYNIPTTVTEAVLSFLFDKTLVGDLKFLGWD